MFLRILLRLFDNLLSIRSVSFVYICYPLYTYSILKMQLYVTPKAVGNAQYEPGGDLCRDNASRQ